MIANTLLLTLVATSSSVVTNSVALRECAAWVETLRSVAPSSRLEPTRTSHDFGIVDKDVVLDTEFSLRVVGDAPLQIEALRPS